MVYMVGVKATPCAHLPLTTAMPFSPARSPSAQNTTRNGTAHENSPSFASLYSLHSIIAAQHNQGYTFATIREGLQVTLLRFLRAAFALALRGQQSHFSWSSLLAPQPQ